MLTAQELQERAENLLLSSAPHALRKEVSPMALLYLSVPVQDQSGNWIDGCLLVSNASQEDIENPERLRGLVKKTRAAALLTMWFNPETQSLTVELNSPTGKLVMTSRRYVKNTCTLMGPRRARHYPRSTVYQ